MSGFVERVVEDWLTSSDERGYQLAFVSCLSRNGHTVKYVSSHTSLEHGKDIVSLSRERQLCAYQLKAGNIRMAQWRVIRDEVLDAAKVPVDMPGTRKRLPDQVFLVLTGNVSDPVRNAISLLNEEQVNRNYPEIQLIELAELVSQLTLAFESFFPTTLGPPSDLVRLHLQDGTGPQDKPLTFSILQSLLMDARGPAKIRRALSNVVIAAQFAAAPFRRAQNHVAEIDTWVLAACCILAIAKKDGLSENRWHLPFELCSEAIDSAANTLLAEVLSRDNFLEGDNALVDSLLLPTRRTLALGYAAAAINSRVIQGHPVRDESARLLDVMQRERPLGSWGEGAWNYTLNLALGLRHTPDGQRAAEGIVYGWLQLACPKKPPRPRDPYWTLDDDFSQREQASDAAQSDSLKVSYTAMSAFGLLTRRMFRQHLNQLWPVFSRYDHAVFVPNEVWASLQWACEQGSLELHRLPIQGSWKNVREIAAGQRSSLFEGVQLRLLPFYLCTYPHRVDASLAGELDYQTSPPSFRSEWTELLV
ncbi:MAG: hypothetical protein IIC26_00785 [Chloroflexi bacterium]|nr:hypothetical protein [Chloroflexota bacterium]